MKINFKLKHLPACLIAGLLAIFFLCPLVQTVVAAFTDGNQFTLTFLYEALLNPLYQEGLLNSFVLACVVTSLVILIALPLAVLSVKYDFPGRTIFTLLILTPMILPPFVGAIGLRQILGQYGALNALLVQIGIVDWANAIDWLAKGRFWAVAFTSALHLYPIFYLNAQAALANQDQSLTEAAANLGCVGWRRFVRVTVPLILPGLFAGGIIVFIWAFTELGTPLMFDYNRVVAVQIYNGLNDIAASPEPYALVLIVLTASSLMYALARGLFGQTGPQGTGRLGTAPLTKKLTGIKGWSAGLFFCLIFLLGALPHLGVIFNSLSPTWYRSILPSAWTARFYQEALSHNLTLPSIRNSLYYASYATLANLAAGTVIAYTLTRTNWRWRKHLDVLAMLPLAVPGIVMAFGYISLSQPGRLLENFNPGTNPAVLLIIAYAIRRLPYMTRAIAAGFQQASPGLEEAAASLGGTPPQVFRRVTLPLIRSHILAGCILAFSFAMLEVSDSLMLAQRQIHFPITKALFELAQILGEGRYLAAALGVWAMLFLLFTMLCAGRLLGKRLGSVFKF